MKTYRLEQINFTGSSKDLIHMLHKGSRAQCPTDEQWMQETAHRMSLTSSATVHTETTDHFVDDLIELELLPILVQQ